MLLTATRKIKTGKIKRGVSNCSPSSSERVIKLPFSLGLQASLLIPQTSSTNNCGLLSPDFPSVLTLCALTYLGKFKQNKEAKANFMLRQQGQIYSVTAVAGTCFHLL